MAAAAMRSSTASYSSDSANAAGSPRRTRAALSMRLCLWYCRSRFRAMPNSHGAPDPSARSLKRRNECQACANVSAVRSSATLSEPV